MTFSTIESSWKIVYYLLLISELSIGVKSYSGSIGHMDVPQRYMNVSWTFSRQTLAAACRGFAGVCLGLHLWNGFVSSSSCVWRRSERCSMHSLKSSTPLTGDCVKNIEGQLDCLWKLMTWWLRGNANTHLCCCDDTCEPCAGDRSDVSTAGIVPMGVESCVVAVVVAKVLTDLHWRHLTVSMKKL